MIRGLYISGMGMQAQMQTLDIVANNVANSNTTGFRGGTAIKQSFPEVLMKSINSNPGDAPHLRYPVGTTGLGVVLSDISINFSNGILTPTGSALDLGIAGSGFFAVQTLNNAGVPQEMFTRSGSFTLTPERTLVNLSGDRVLNTGGSPITLPEGLITVSPAGEIFVDGNLVTTLRMVDFEDLTALRPFGHTLFTTIDGAVETAFEGTIHQGYLEGSNVNIIREMVSMINVARAYELNQRMVTIHDTTLGQAVSEIARR